MGGFIVAINKRGAWSGRVVQDTVTTAASLSARGATHSAPEAHVFIVQCHFEPGCSMTQPTNDGSLTLAKRGHLTNVAALRRSLASAGANNSGQCSDADLMMTAYQVWGADLGGRLEGNFTFVVWDARDQRLTVVRDHLGIRPCFVFENDHLLAVTTNPALLNALPETSATPDPGPLADYLTGQCATRTRTFFREISRPMPATVTTYRADGRRATRRYWEPALNFDRARTPPSAYTEPLLSALSDSVEDACRSTGAVVAELSGGVDSSCIAGMAAKLQQAGMVPSFRSAMSVIYPGYSCDESGYISSFLDMHRVKWDGIVVPRLPELQNLSMERHGRLYPDPRSYFDDVRPTVLLNGDGGDELFQSGGLPIGPGLLPNRGRLEYLWWAGWRDPKHLMWRLRRELVRPHVPDRFLAWYLKARRASPPPQIITTRAHDLAADVERDENAGLDPHQALARELLWVPPARTVNEGGEFEGLPQGYEQRAPLLDMRIVSVAAAIPIGTHGWEGTWRSVQRVAFGSLLPLAIQMRNDKAEFSEVRDSKETPNRDLDLLYNLGLVRQSQGHGPQHGGVWTRADANTWSLAAGLEQILEEASSGRFTHV